MSPRRTLLPSARSVVVTLVTGAALVVPGSVALDASAAHRDGHPARTAAPAAATVEPGTILGTPAPTRDSLRADGPFMPQRQVLPAAQRPSGLGEVEFYTPAQAPEGRRAAVVVMPGYGGDVATVAWMAKRLASHGYVAMLTRSTLLLDFPAARANAFRTAVGYLPTKSPVAAQVDPERLGIWGFSMGGGAAVEAASTLPQLKAVVGAFPWNLRKSFPTLTPAALILTGEKDTTAAANVYGEPLYAGLTGAREKAMAQLTGAQHTMMQTPDPRSSEMTLAWFGRFLLDDQRFGAFLCPGPATGADYTKYAASCPM